MPAEVPVKMAEMGIKAKGQTVLQKGVYVVIRVIIEHVDIRQLLAQKTGWDSWLYCCETPAVADHMLIRKVKDKLQQELPPKLIAQMAEKGLTIEIVSKSAQEQAEFQEHQMSVLALADKPTSSFDPKGAWRQ